MGQGLCGMAYRGLQVKGPYTWVFGDMYVVLVISVVGMHMVNDKLQHGVMPLLELRV